MGSLLSKFRKQPTTTEQLKKIEDGLKKIEEYKRSTERKQKRTVANVIIYGAALYILACIIVVVWYLPESWVVRLALVIPLVLVPVFIYYMKWLISTFFQRKMRKANEEYEDLQQKKKDIIDNVMETETFNKAKEILSKYAPEKLEKKEKAAVIPLLGKESAGDLRKRTASSVTNSTTTLSKPQIVPVGGRAPALQRRDLNISSGELQLGPTIQPNIQLPEPLFPRERSFTDKLVEYIVGDGPSYRYALICKHCCGHNGMAMKEEFPYMSFVCCYCKKLNASKNQRPTPPRLPDPIKLQALPAPLGFSNQGFIQPVMEQRVFHRKPTPSPYLVTEPDTISEDSSEERTIASPTDQVVTDASTDQMSNGQVARSGSENGVSDEEETSDGNEEEELAHSVSPVGDNPPAHGEEQIENTGTTTEQIEKAPHESGDEDQEPLAGGTATEGEVSDHPQPTSVPIKSDVNASALLESEEKTIGSNL